MKHLYFTLASLFVSFFLSAQPVNVSLSSTSNPTDCQIVRQDSREIELEFQLSDFQYTKVETDRGLAWKLSAEGATSLLEKSAPDILRFSESLIIPEGSELQIEIINSTYKEFQNVLIAPSKGNLLRTQNPSEIPYEFGSLYEQNSFYPAELVQTRKPYTFRDVNGQNVVFYPFQYNPQTKILRVYNSINIRLTVTNGAAFSSFKSGTKIIPEFAKIYENRFLNAAQMLGRYEPSGEEGNMLILCYSEFMDEMQPFVDWKISTGMPVEMRDIAEAGSQYADIRTFIQNYYETNGLTFLLLVGDNAQIPAGYRNGPSDNYYSYLDGDDHYPEILVGRFSAETESQVATQVQKVLDYERDPYMDNTEWYKTVTGIASKQGPGDDDEYDYQHVRNMQQDLLGYTYNSNPEYFDGSQGGNDAAGNPVASMIEDQLDEGTGLILYTGHGSTYAWSTSGFNSSGVNNLENVGMLPFIWSVACVNGNFPNATCFAEAWLRATHLGEPSGAIATAMSSINQPWDPPMDGQDEMVDILVESYQNNIKRSFGGISIDGMMKMNDDYGWEGYRVTDTWVIFGDPSVMVRTDVPQDIAAQHPEQLLIGTSQLSVQCDVQNAKIALSSEGEIHAVTNVEGGQAMLVFDELMEVDTLTLVITAYNHIPYITEIAVIPPEGPYVIYSSSSINDANAQLDYAETANMNLSMKNVGIDPAENVSVSLSIEDDYVSLVDNQEDYGNIQPSETKEITDAFSLRADVNVPDMHYFTITVNATDGTDSWASAFTMQAHAPQMHFGDYAVIDSEGNQDGVLDPGESGSLKLSVMNRGSSAANVVSAVLSTQDAGIGLSDPQQDLGTIEINGENDASFPISADVSLPSGTIILFNLQLTTEEGLVVNEGFTVNIGKVPVVVIDLDGNHNSGSVIYETILSLGVSADYYTEIPEDLDIYSAAFVSLGMFSVNHVLTVEEGQTLADFLIAGNNIYMEGGDTWYYDQQNNPTAVHPLFRINGTDDGQSDLGVIQGLAGLPSADMSFIYEGDNYWVDRIEPVGAAIPLLRNKDPQYYTAIAGMNDTYKTIGASMEFGGLADAYAPSTKAILAAILLDFFDLYNSNIVPDFRSNTRTIEVGGQINFMDNSLGEISAYEWIFPGGSPATSSEKNPVVTYSEEGFYDVGLTVTNGLLTHTINRTAYVKAGNPVGIEESEIFAASQLSPNPAKESSALQISGNHEGMVQLQLMNSKGELVFSDYFPAQTAVYTLNTRGYASGLYYLQIISANRSESLKLIVE